MHKPVVFGHQLPPVLAELLPLEEGVPELTAVIHVGYILIILIPGTVRERPALKALRAAAAKVGRGRTSAHERGACAGSRGDRLSPA